LPTETLLLFTVIDIERRLIQRVVNVCATALMDERKRNVKRALQTSKTRVAHRHPCASHSK
jgi:hypothetical protein